ncbi:hypothetical protein C723_0352 [Christiangramia flava JLT2011]|uniref:Uncharacterized protein n=1 Tax=Christiangramia flava JLT2011 TaxID=1229726 RepID=A0A1L7I3T1_9FLAO|nr:hypothetical protein GRFL_1546 [Christiangramia flava JLT2011]OSS40943.1 hypothetical protein C723_0352 [Christiangramia flava JLT2011]
MKKKTECVNSRILLAFRKLCHKVHIANIPKILQQAIKMTIFRSPLMIES